MGNEAQNAISMPESATPAARLARGFRALAPGAALIFLLTFAAYWPVLHGQFIWDDPLLVEKNPLVTHALNLRSVWFQTDFPLTVVAFWLQWLFWGKASAGYHVVNILLHAINSILVWRVLLRLNIRGAWLAGAIFAVHPVCAASVAWISELKNTLSLPFFLLSIWFYLRDSEGKNSDHASPITHHAFYALSLIAFLLALLAKTSTVMLPVVLLGCVWWIRGRLTKRDWLRTAPYFALALAFGLMSVWFQTHQTFTTGKVQTENFWGRLAAAGMAVWFYLEKALLPLNLNLIYPHWKINAAAPLSYLPVLLLFGAVIVFWKFRRSWGRSVLFGFGYFVVTLFPVLGFFDMYFLAISRVADHFQYLPLVGIVGLVAGAIYWDVPRMRLDGAELLLKTTLIVALAFLTVQRAKVMANEETLWRDTVAKNPNAWSAQNNLACILAEQNKIAEAITHFDASLQLYPDNAQAHGNLGKALTLQNKFSEAEAHLRTAAALKPKEPEFHRSLAYALGGQGKTDEALGQLRQAADLEPGVERRLELAGMLHQSGKDREAIAEYRRVLGAQPLSVEVLNNLAWLLATSAVDSARNGPDAVGYAESACQQTQNQDAMTLGTLAAAYAEAGRFSDAVATAEKAANLAAAAGNSRFATINTQLMRLYRTGKPYHEKASPGRAP
jgi:Flp pilus assembly protein TadD